MRRLLLLLLPLVLVLSLAVPVLAAGLYSADITVSDSSSVDRTGVGALVPFGTTQAVDLGYISASANDTRMFEGTGSRDFMVASDRLGILAPSLLADQEKTYRFEAGWAASSDGFGVIVGGGGYITTLDVGLLEPGANFTVEQSGWIDTASGEGKFLVDKGGVFRTYISATGNVTSFITAGDNIWEQVAPQPGTATYLNDLVVYHGKLYGGTMSNGSLYEWNGTNAWVEVAPQLGGETKIYSLAVFNDKIYGGTGGNGKLYEWNGTNLWVEKAGKLGTETRILDLVVYNSKLYGSTGVQKGALYEWNGTNLWVEVAPQLGGEILITALAVYNDKIYGGSGTAKGALYEWNGTNLWVEKAPQLGAIGSIRSLAVYHDKLYGGTDATGELYEWNDVNLWVQKAPQLGIETQIFSLAVYNDKLYGGSSTLTGELYEWNGVNLWVSKAPQLGIEGTIQSLTVYNGKLYAGTASLANLYEWGDSLLVTASDVESGEYRITTSADTTNFWIEKDGVIQDTVALGGASVTDTDDDWVFMSNNVMPYSDNTTIWVGGARKLWYQPNYIIESVGATATLIDREGSNDGEITWGSNSDLVVSVGGLSSLVTYTSTPTGEADPPTVLPLPGAMDMWAEETDVSVDWLPPELVGPAATGTPIYDTGDVSGVEGADTITGGGGTAWDSDWDGYTIVIDGDIYVIESVDGPADITLTTDLTEDYVADSYVISLPSLGWGINTLYAVLMLFGAIGVGVGVAIATGSALLAAIAVSVGLVVAASTGAVGWWVVIVFAIFGASYLVAARSM